MDVASKLYNLLSSSSNWLETNPTIDSIIFRYDEFDPNSPSIQLLIENFPDKSTWVVDRTYRYNHNVRIGLYFKPIRYDPDDIEDLKVLWFNVKEEINRILALNKFNVPDVTSIDLTNGWNDKNTLAVGRGDKTTKEPIIWRTQQIVKCVYYLEE